MFSDLASLADGRAGLLSLSLTLLPSLLKLEANHPTALLTGRRTTFGSGYGKPSLYAGIPDMSEALRSIPLVGAVSVVRHGLAVGAGVD